MLYNRWYASKYPICENCVVWFRLLVKDDILKLVKASVRSLLSKTAIYKFKYIQKYSFFLMGKDQKKNNSNSKIMWKVVVSQSFFIKL